MNFTGNTKKLILVYEGMPTQNVDERVDVMITPQFYTLKREPLPIKYSYQAKKIAPSLFDGLLEGEGPYAYYVEKSGEGWEFIAYDPERIKAFLREAGLPPEKVSKLFFVQQIADQIDRPIALGERQALVNLDGIVTVVPRVALEETEQFAGADTLPTPKRGVTIGVSTEDSLLTMRQAIVISALLFSFAAVWIAEGVLYGGGGQQEQAEIARLLKAYPALQSKYARKSVAQKYQRLDRVERKKREVIKRLSKILFKGISLNNFILDNNHYEATFFSTEKSLVQRLKQMAEKEKFNTSLLNGGRAIRIKGQL